MENLSVSDRLGLFKKFTGRRHLSDDVDFNKLAELTEGCTKEDIKKICDCAAEFPWKKALKTSKERDITKPVSTSLCPTLRLKTGKERDITILDFKKSIANFEAERDVSKKLKNMGGMSTKKLVGIQDIAKGAANLRVLGIEPGLNDDDKNQIVELLNYHRKTENWGGFLEHAANMKALDMDVGLTEVEKRILYEKIQKKLIMRLIIDYVTFSREVRFMKCLGLLVELPDRHLKEIHKLRNGWNILCDLGVACLLDEEPTESERTNAYKNLKEYRGSSNWVDFATLAALMKMAGMDTEISDKERKEITGKMQEWYSKCREGSCYDSHLRRQAKVLELDHKRWFDKG